MNGWEVPKPVLMHWYQCGRKLRYDSQSEASEVAAGITDASGELHPYQCPHADDAHWHIGRPKRDVSDRPRWRPHDERRQQLKNARKTWDRIAYRQASS